MNKVLPILFNTDMVRAILDDRKTVTRRVCKNTNEYTVPLIDYMNINRRTYAVQNFADREHTDSLSIAERTMPIFPGDILYVRETWRKSPYTNNYVYLADGAEELFSQSCDSEILDDTAWKWKPSIHMPKEAARIFLKVTDVRVERLQDITDEQAIKEGCSGVRCSCNGMAYACTDCYNTGWAEPPVLEFSYLWNSTCKKSLQVHGWDANPWVWVIEFERCEKPVSGGVADE